MGAVKAHMWKELVQQAEIAKKSAKKFEPSVPKNRWGVNNKERDTTQSFQSKGKEITVVELSREAPTKQKSANSNNNLEFKFLQK